MFPGTFFSLPAHSSPSASPPLPSHLLLIHLVFIVQSVK